MSMIVVVVVCSLLGSLALGLWVFLALIGTGVAGLAIFRDLPLGRLLAQNLWNASTIESLLSLPMFILMAEILFRTRLTENMFNALVPWTRNLPGRLAHVNVVGWTLFAAVCASSAATTAIVGRITTKELIDRGYAPRLVFGSLAGAGTFGLMIPPSFILIVYGVLAEESILKLFAAGVIPGLILAAAYMSYIGMSATLDKSLVPDETAQGGAGWTERLRALGKLAPILALITAIMGSMYGGIASPTEAAVIGVFGAFMIAIWERSLSIQALGEACLAAVRTSCMLGMITVGAVFLSVSMGFLGVPKFIAGEITALGLTPMTLILVLFLFYVLLGCFLEGMSAIVMTLPIVLPLVTDAGYNKIWFGIFLVLVIELAQMTPPVGFNLFVIQGVTGESILNVARAAIPYFLIICAVTLTIVIYPGIITFLPSILF